MRILADRSVSGMISYHNASEIPALVVMDLVDGLNLNDAVRSRYITDWSNVLRISVALAKIIRSAHSLPERVLHRDIRPSNVMLKDIFYDSNSCEVVVLDFDLSWHRDANELSVMSNSANGYLAPEQVHQRVSDSTRNTLVDSYGLGMTLYFLRTANEPSFNQHKHTDWLDKLHNEVCKYTCADWQSLPKRFARLISFATQDVQSKRWDMSQIQGELERLRQAEQCPLDVRSAELFAEEITYRSELKSLYKWDSDALKAVAILPNGLTISCEALETKRSVKLSAQWTRSGTQDNSSRKLGKFIKDASDRISVLLTTGGWNRPTVTSRSNNSYFFSSEIQVNNLFNNMSCVVKAVDGIIDALSL